MTKDFSKTLKKYTVDELLDLAKEAKKEAQNKKKEADKKIIEKAGRIFKKYRKEIFTSNISDTIKNEMSSIFNDLEPIKQPTKKSN